MSTHILGGLALGIVAIVLGAGWIGGAISHQRRHAEYANTYAQTGGPFYAVAQIGCAAIVILAGLGLIAVALLGGLR